jgi:hypothetical protein
MPKLSKEELTKRKAEMVARARSEVAKTEVVQFRLDAPNIEKLYSYAATNKVALSALVREWVLDRLEQETTEQLASPANHTYDAGEAYLTKPTAGTELAACLDAINRRLLSVEKKVGISAAIDVPGSTIFEGIRQKQATKQKKR